MKNQLFFPTKTPDNGVPGNDQLEIINVNVPMA